MLVGDKKKLALESLVICHYQQRSLLALGSFLIHVGGREYGVRSHNSSLLANSFDSVKSRIRKRGGHKAVYLAQEKADVIANSLIKAIYSDSADGSSFFGMSADAYVDALYEDKIIWVPDGDAAFDDGSHILQIDIGEDVRVIAFKLLEHEKFNSLVDVVFSGEIFYATLERWIEDFENEWQLAPKSTSVSSH